MQSAAAGYPSTSAAPQGDEALAAGIDLITAASAAMHDIPAERWKITYKFTISLSNQDKKYFWKKGKRVDQILRRMSKPEMSDGQEAPPEILTINK